MTKSVDEIITDLGGAPAIAEAVKLTPGAVRLWKHRKIIPRTSWPDLLRAFPERLTLDDLMATERAAA